MEVTTKSPYDTSDATRERFDAQAWGVVHYMLFGRPDDRADRVNLIAKLLLEGRTSAEAVQQAFGSIDELESAYLQYQRKPISNFARLKVESNNTAKDFRIRTLAPAEALALRAGLHAAMGRSEDARTLLSEARKVDAINAGSYDVEGLMFERNGQLTEARLAFAKAVELNSSSFYSHYRLSLFLAPQIGSGERAAIEKLLRRSIALNGSFAPAQGLLAFLLLRADQAQQALAPAERAVTLDPRDTGARLTLASVYARLSRMSDAIGHARAGRTLARNDQQRKEADDLIAALTRPAQ
jgi:Flp pilus assembly protein TadD